MSIFRLHKKNIRLLKTALGIATFFFVTSLLVGPLQTVYAGPVSPNESQLKGIDAAFDQSGAIGDEKGPSCEGAWIPSFYCMAESFFSSVMWLSGVLVGWGGMLFDYVLQYTIISNPIDLMYSGIVVGWTVIRDFANLVFIFILLYIGIATILDMGGINAKETLAKVIIIALFINFSFFITRFVIDISNIFSYQIYKGITTNADMSIGTAIRKSLYVEGNYQKQDIVNLAKDGAGWKILGVMSAVAAMNLVAAWVLFSASLLFIGRLVVFVVLIVFAPAAFVCYILPGTRKHFNEWKDMLINQALVAPIFLFFVLVIVTLLRSNLQLARGASGTNDESSSLLFVFILATFMFLFALKTTRKYSGDIGKTFTGWGTTAAGMLAGGAVGFAARQTVGRAALAVSQSERLKEVGKETGVPGYFARMALRKSEGASKSTMDLRNSSRVAKLGLGKGSKSTYAGLREKNEKYYEQQAKVVGSSVVSAKDIDGRTLGSYKEEITKADKTLAEKTSDYEKKAFEFGMDDKRTVAAKIEKRVAQDASDKLGARRAHVTELEAITDDYKRAEKIAEVRGKERAVNLMSSRNKEAAPGAPGITSKYFAAIGWNAPAFSAARKYFRNSSKTNKDKAIDAIKELIPDEKSDKPA